jgi:hypothetical protein
MSCPDKITAGDSLEFTVVVDDYLASDGWALVYRFAPRFTTPVFAPFAVNATNDADRTHTITRTAAQTATWPPGDYGWTRYVERTVLGTYQRQTLTDLASRGQLVVLQDSSTAVQGFDNRTQAQKAVEDLKAALATFQSSGGTVKSYTIGDRSVTFQDEGDILRRLSYWEARLADEEEAEQAAAGMPNQRVTYARLQRE